MESATKNNLRNCILNLTEPIVVKNHLKWKILNWNLEKWTEVLSSSSKKLFFHLGKNCFTRRPQFSNDLREMTFKEFLEYEKANPEEWLYFDYKHLVDWFKDVDDIQELYWGDFGFPDRGSSESTMWIGSKGAHTPCHLDTYGCNIIAQVHGHKRWILFPSNENVQPKRIPYEESSIFSKYNFFSPELEELKGIHNCRTVILQPGDVLILPHRWWHYVENIDLGISINTWVPQPSDDEERVGEAIAQTIIYSMLQGAKSKKMRRFVNEEFAEELGTEKSLNLILEMLSRVDKSTVKVNSRCDVQEISNFFKNIETLPILSDEEFKILMKTQRERFKKNLEKSQGPQKRKEDDYETILNAMLHPDVIELIKNKLLETKD